MRAALIGDFDTFLFRGLARPAQRGPQRLSPGLNLARGFQELGIQDLHYVVCTPEVQTPTVEDGPFGRLHRLPNPRFSGSASFFLWRRHLILEELAKIKPDVVHGQGTEAEYGFTAVTSGYPHVVTLHGILERVHATVPPPFFSLDHVPRWLERLVLGRARHVICISRGVADYLRRRGSRAQTHLIPNAVGPAFFDVVPRVRGAGEAILLFVGTIYPLKGLLNLVEALPLIEKKSARLVRLRVIGGRGGGRAAERYEQLLRQRAQQLGVAARIDWLGVQQAEAVAAALAKSDVLVLPSFCENMPMCIAEAMAAGVPVAATTAPYIPDLVEDGVTGCLVEPGRSEELATMVTKILLDVPLADRLALAARVRALAEFTPVSVATKTLAVYEMVGNSASR